ncbi:hypothetical protein GJ744_001584 [Endocarpon pusillum]|uniref:Uncharacterized protein n=1 Tax=Endocarpon pusillum TaxID=364733 RepID=A0A8H7AD64_9EURO|nr:hypothetical protein GJ744_001584 [Endocarpon pusillum]
MHTQHKRPEKFEKVLHTYQQTPRLRFEAMTLKALHAEIRSILQALSYGTLRSRKILYNHIKIITLLIHASSSGQKSKAM